MQVSIPMSKIQYPVHQNRGFTRPLPKPRPRHRPPTQQSSKSSSAVGSILSAAIIRSIQVLLRKKFRPQRPSLFVSCEFRLGTFSLSRIFFPGKNKHTRIHRLPYGFYAIDPYRDGKLQRKILSRRFGPLQIASVTRPDQKNLEPEIQAALILQKKVPITGNMPLDSHVSLEVPLKTNSDELTFKLKGDVVSLQRSWLPNLKLGIGGEWRWRRTCA